MVISPVEQLLRDVETQEAAHRRLVDAYARLAGSCHDEALRVLLHMLRADAERDHHLLSRAAGSLRNSIFWLRQPDPLPPIDGGRVQSAEVLTALEDLLRRNRERARSLKTFRQAARHLYDGLLEIVAGSALASSRRHIEMLTYLIERVRQAPSIEGGKPARTDQEWFRTVVEDIAFEAALAEVC